jgi:hypothetical protein
MTFLSSRARPIKERPSKDWARAQGWDPLSVSGLGPFLTRSDRARCVIPFSNTSRTQCRMSPPNHHHPMHLPLVQAPSLSKRAAGLRKSVWGLKDSLSKAGLLRTKSKSALHRPSIFDDDDDSDAEDWRASSGRRRAPTGGPQSDDEDDEDLLPSSSGRDRQARARREALARRAREARGRLEEEKRPTSGPHSDDDEEEDLLPSNGRDRQSEGRREELARRAREARERLEEKKRHADRVEAARERIRVAASARRGGREGGTRHESGAAGECPGWALGEGWAR